MLICILIATLPFPTFLRSSNIIESNWTFLSFFPCFLPLFFSRPVRQPLNTCKRRGKEKRRKINFYSSCCLFCGGWEMAVRPKKGGTLLDEINKLSRVVYYTAHTGRHLKYFFSHACFAVYRRFPKRFTPQIEQGNTHKIKRQMFFHL